MTQFGDYLAALRNHANLSQTELAKYVGSSRSTISRLELNSVPFPFRGSSRKLAITLGELLCTSTKAAEKYLELARLDNALLSESESLQIGIHVPPANTIEEIKNRISAYEQLLVHLEKRETLLGTRRTPQIIKARIQEYTITLRELQFQLDMIQGRKPNTNILQAAAVTSTSDKMSGKLIVGREQGAIAMNPSMKNLFELASPQAKWLMSEVDIDCFAIDDCITIASSRDFQGWRAPEIETTLLPSPIVIPHDLDELRQQKIPEIERDYTNGKHYRLVSFTPSFGDPDSLKVTLAPVNFFDYYSLTCYFDESLLQDATGKPISIRNKYGKTALTYMSADSGASLIPTPISIQCIVITQDNYVLLTRRSALVAFYPNHWSASFEETMNAQPGPENRAERSADSDFIQGAIRGLEEEFAITANQIQDVVVLSLNVEYLTLSIDVITVIKLKNTANEIRQKWLLGAWDKNEANKIAIIPASLESILEILFEPDRLWHPTSRMRLIQFLFHQYGIDAVTQSLQERERCKRIQ